MESRQKKNIGIAQMLICATLWSTGGILIKLVPWNPFVIAGGRALIAGLVVAIFLGVRRMPFIVNRRTLLAGLFMSMTCVLFVAANKLTTAANAIVLQFTAPVFILVFSVLFFRRRFARADVAAVVLTLGGISLFFFDQLTPGHLLGNCVAIFCGICMAWMYILVGESNEAESVSAILVAQCISVLAAVPFAVVYPPQPAVGPVLSMLALGIFQLGIPYILFARASETCPPLLCSLLGAVEPLLNPVWVFLFDGEAPGLFALLGGVVVVATVTIWCVYGDRKKTVTV